MSREQAERIVRIRLLLPFLDAYDYQPLCSTSALVLRQAVRGEVASRKRPCQTCRGDKVVRVRGITSSCPDCLSERTGRPLGWEWVDGNVEQAFQRKIGSEETGAFVPASSVHCDACGGQGAHGNGRRCQRCGGSGRRVCVGAVLRPFRVRAERDASPEPSGDPVLSAAERRANAGSLDALISALAELHESWASLYRLVLSTEDPASLRDPLPRFHEAGLLFLEARMPDPIEVPSEAFLYERRRRGRARSRGVSANVAA